MISSLIFFRLVDYQGNKPLALRLGCEKIDSILNLHEDDMIGIFGETRYSNALVTTHKIKDVFIIITLRITSNAIELPSMFRIGICIKKDFDMY